MLKDVLYIKDFKRNLLFVSRFLKENDFKMLFSKYGCYIQGHSRTNEAVYFGKNEGDMY